MLVLGAACAITLSAAGCGGEKKKTDTAKTDTAKTDTAKTDTAKTDTAKTDTAKTDTAKTDTAKTDTAKVGVDKAKLTVSPPLAPVTVKQGGVTKVDIGVKRENFKEPVTVEFKDLPKGVTVEEKDMKVAADKGTATYTLKAANDAEVVTDKVVTVNVNGTDTVKGMSTFKLTVEKK